MTQKMRSIMKKKIDLAIFDLDGTLVNSLDDLGNAVNKALEEFGYPKHEMEKYRFFVGNGAMVEVVRRVQFCWSLVR